MPSERSVSALVVSTPRPGPIPKAASASAFALAGCASVITAGLVPHNAEWSPAWIGLTLLYAVGAVALWRGRPWAREFMLGVAGWGLCAWVDAAVVLGLDPVTVAATLGHGLLVALVAFIPSALARRHAWSLLLASAALPCGVAFGLAPGQAPVHAVAMLIGTGLLVVGAVGLARGRAWGLVVQLAGAPLVALAAAAAPALVFLHAEHPMLGENGLLLGFVGMCAAGLAAASLIPFVGPVVRFLQR